MGHTLEIGQTCCYWSNGADKPLAAICMDCDHDGYATLQVFTAAGGRFTKVCNHKQDARGEGWTNVGERVH